MPDETLQQRHPSPVASPLDRDDAPGGGEGIEEGSPEEQHLLRVIEGANDGMWEYDLARQTVYYSPRWKAMLGFDEDEVGEDLGEWRARIHPDDCERVLATWNAYLRGETPHYKVEQRLRCKDGTYRWILSRGVALRGADGHAYRIAGWHTDITEQKQTIEQLREAEAQYRSIFEGTSDAILIIDLAGKIVEANPAACAMHGYTYDELLGLSRRDFVHPESFAVFPEAVEFARRGQTLHTRARHIRKDGTVFHVEVNARGFTYRGEPHVLSAVRDITERVQRERMQRHQAREDALRADVSVALAGRGSLTDVLRRVAEALIRHIEASFSCVWTYDRDTGSLVLQATAGDYPDPMERVGHVPIEDHMVRELARGSKPFVFNDVSTVLNMEGRDWAERAGVTSFTELPLVIEEQLVGVVSIFSRGRQSHDAPELLASVADAIAQGIERKQAYALLERRVAERTHELSTLLDVARGVASTLELRPLLTLIMDQVQSVMGTVGAAIFRLDLDRLIPISYRGPGAEEDGMRLAYTVGQLAPIWDEIVQGHTVVVNDIYAPTVRAAFLRDVLARELDGNFSFIRAWMCVPLRVKNRLIGIITVLAPQVGHFTAEHEKLGLALASQAAVALENARLFGRAQEVAALEERQKLARELHDSVSQALYGIALGARTARTLLDRDPAQVADPLDYVLQLADAGLAEMRALIFELRPESLETEGLAAAILKQSAALRARHGISVTADLCDEPNISLDAKEVLYRIGQEAMHNTVKHARATDVHVRLAREDGDVLLEVADNGVGFDTSGAFPGHLGLRSMRERVTRQGGTVEITSAPGSGTRILVRLRDCMTCTR